MTAPVLRQSVPALLLAVLVLAPFLGKAFTMDDTVFLFEARHALADPLHPLAFEMTWTYSPERISRVVPTGPVMAWLLVPTILAGGAEWVAHGTQLVLLCLSIVLTVSLALRLGLAPRWAGAAGLLLAATPAVLGMAGTAMPDVASMALAIAAIERLVAWRQTRRALPGVLAALLLGLAPMARPHLLLLFGVGALFLVGDALLPRAWFEGSWTRWAPLAAGLLVTVAIAAITGDPGASGGNPAGAAMVFSSAKSVPRNVVAFAAHWALAMPLALPWALLRWREVLLRPWALLLATAAAAVLMRAAHGSEAPYALAPVAGLGAAVLVDVLADAVRRRDGAQLALLAWLLVALPAAIYVHLPAKYLVASAPAAAILVARRLAEAPRLRTAVLAAAVALGLGLGVAILRADEVFAGLGREAARALIAPQVAAGRRVWYVGHWGFQWYAERAGARYFNVTPPHPQPGDLIVSCQNCEPSLELKEMAEVAHLGRTEDRTPGGRVMSRESGAGFFSNSWGYLPWAWGHDVIDAFDIWVARPR